MFAGYNGTPQLYTTDVTGNYSRYNANAIGENDEKIKTMLREKYHKNLDCKEGAKLALEIFRELRGEEFSSEKFDIGMIKSDKKIIKLSGKDL